MAYEIELLPSDTTLNWDAEGRVRCIQQGEAAFFIHYDVCFGSDQGDNMPKKLAPSQAAPLACRVVGLSNAEAGEYLGVPTNRIKNELTALAKRLGIKEEGHHTGGYQPLHALAKLAQRGVVELGDTTGLAWEADSQLYKLIEGFFAGKDAARIGEEYGMTSNAVFGRIRYGMKRNNLERPIAYALHLMAAGAVGDINFKPHLMDKLSSLSPKPSAGVSPIKLRQHGSAGRRAEFLPPDVQFYWGTDDYLTCIRQRDGMFFLRYDVSANPDNNAGVGLTKLQGLIAACRFVGLTHKEMRRYLNMAQNTVSTHIGNTYERIGSRGDPGIAHQASLYAMARFAKAGAIELGQRATLTRKPSPEVLGFIENILGGKPLRLISRDTGYDTTDIAKEMRDAYKAAGFQSLGGYALHLLAAQEAGHINYNPARMKELPSLVTSPAARS